MFNEIWFSCLIWLILRLEKMKLCNFVVGKIDFVDNLIKFSDENCVV